MIALLIPIVARMGVPARVQRIAAWLLVLVIIALVAIAIGAWWRSTLRQERDEAVRLDRQDVAAEAANRVMEATAEADRNLIAAQEVADRNSKELQHEVDTKGGDAAAGPAVTGVLERMRQQAARGDR